MAENLADLVVSVSADFSDIEPQLATLAGKFDDVGQAAVDTGGLVNDGLNPALHDLGEHSEEAHGHLEHLLETLLEFSGIEFGIEKLREMVDESFELASAIEKSTIAIGALRGNVEGTTERIEELEKTANRFGVSFEELLPIEQKFAALGLSVEQAESAMKASIAAAAALNTSVSSAASMIDRLSLSGVAGARQLVALGLQTKDLGEVMGVTGDKIKDVFKGLDQATRLEILEAALQKFDGAAAKVADSFSNRWQKVKNDFNSVLATMGSLLQKSLIGWAEAWQWISDHTAANIAGMIQDVHKLEDAAHEMGLAFPQLTAQYRNGTLSAREYDEALRKLIESHNEHAKALEGEKDIQEKVSEELKKLGEAQAYAKAKIEIDAEAAHQKALLELKREAIKEDEKINGENAIDNLARLQALNAQELKITEDAINKKLALEKGKAEELKDLTLGAQLQAAQDKANEDNLKSQEHVNEELAKNDRELAKLIQANITETEAFREKVHKHILELNAELLADAKKAAEEEDISNNEHQVKMLDAKRSEAASELARHLITADQKREIDRQLESQELALQRQSLEQELAFLDSSEKLVTDYASKRQAILGKISVLGDKGELEESKRNFEQLSSDYKLLGVHASTSYDVQAADAEAAYARIRAAGTLSADDQIKAWLNVEKVVLQANAAKGNIVDKTGLGIIQDIDKSWKSLGGDIATGVMQGKTFGQTFHQVWTTFATDILTTVINALDQMIFKLAIIKAIQASLGGLFGGGVGSGGGVGFLGAFTHAKGGDISQDMVSILHAGEVVLTEGQGSALGKAIDSGAMQNLSGQGKGGDTYVTVNGATTGLLDELANYMVKQGRRSGVAW